MSDSLSLRYRPKKLSQVIGQPVVVKAFTNAFKYNSLHHAYILSGAFGCGKTTIGRILAAMENCEQGPTLEPCQKCKNCVEIFAGKSNEVKEMDAASHGLIDDIRSLQKEIRQATVYCRTRYVILDEAHSLSGAAAEAALKMIEEPPPNVRFILATTEAHKFKDTIHSRCIMWKLYKVSVNELYNHLEKVAKCEEVNIDKDALRIAASYAKGSVRNALQNLQTIINYVGDKEITKQDAIEALGAVDDTLYSGFFEAIVDGGVADSMNILNKILADGKDIGKIISDMVGYLDGLLQVKIKNVELNVSDEMRVRMEEQTKKIKGNIILYMLKSLVEVNYGIEYSIDPQALLDAFIVKSVLFVKNNQKK